MNLELGENENKKISMKQTTMFVTTFISIYVYSITIFGGKHRYSFLTKKLMLMSMFES